MAANKIGLLRSEINPERAIKNMKIASELFKFAYAIKYHQIQLKNPDLSGHEIHQLTVKLFDKATV